MLADGGRFAGGAGGRVPLDISQEGLSTGGLNFGKSSPWAAALCAAANAKSRNLVDGWAWSMGGVRWLKPMKVVTTSRHDRSSIQSHPSI
eukprot:6888648-Prymnesium_polylepis.1